MGKLFNLKNWLTVADTAHHLSTLFDEEVGEADVLRLALDGHLKLSVNFVNHTPAKCGKVIRIDDAYESETPSDKAIRINDELSLIPDDKVTTIDGVWDLPMLGSERLNIEHAFQNLNNGPDVTLQCLESAFVGSLDGVICQLNTKIKSGIETEIVNFWRNINQNSKKEDGRNLPDKHKTEQKHNHETNSLKSSQANYYPAFSLPEDSVFVVRTDAIREFEKSQIQSDTSQKDPDAISESERNTVLKLILGMAAAKYGFNHNSPRNAASGDNAGSISADLESLSLKIDSDTVRKYLQEAADQYSDIIVYPKES